MIKFMKNKVYNKDNLIKTRVKYMNFLNSEFKFFFENNILCSKK